MTDDGLKIVELTAENFKRLKAVHIVPGDANTVVITGKNAQGKSSVLDSIWAALAGKDGAVQRPIRDGERKATITLDLGDFVVTRKWTGATSTLTVSSGNAKYTSPQKVLDELIGRLSFDPLAFATMEPAKQRATLVDVAGIVTAVAEVEQQRREAYEARTESNRDVKRLRAQLEGLPNVPAGTPDEEIDVRAVVERMNKLNRLDDLRADAKGLKASIEKLQAQYDEIVHKGLALAEEIGEGETIHTLSEQADQAQVTNAHVRAKTQVRALETELDAAEAYSEQMTQRIQGLDEHRETMIQEAALPIEGLSFDEEGVLYNDIPFAQASAAERLRVSVAMAMAMNPRVRVIRITDGSLLDSDNMALIESMAAEKDFQVWIERVGESGDVGIVIEDGEVKA